MIVFLAFVGLVLGAIFGAGLGIGAGLLWTTIFHTSDFEGYSGMLVFTGFAPAGAMIGGLAGAIGMIQLTRDPKAPPSAP